MSKRKAESVRYGAAVEEIETILESIDRDEIDIDDLSEKVERAVQLIRVCQEKLRSTEMRVTEVLESLHEEPEEEAQADSP
jgi:exodeoxyribonuclease VII small subunit